MYILEDVLVVRVIVQPGHKEEALMSGEGLKQVMRWRWNGEGQRSRLMHIKSSAS